MYSKILITGKIEILTGMHIGGSDAFAAIGAVDSPVIRDARTKDPIIPGSSLKGKMRTLLARSVEQKIGKLPEHHADNAEIRRLFGATKPDIVPSRLIFSDCFLMNKDALRETGLTEVKFENTINRNTAIAMPRQIERVVRGAQFDLRLVYEACEAEEMTADFENIAKGLALLQMDYLGGHGTRGYGRIKFSDLRAEKTDDNQEINIDELNAILKKVN